MALTALNYDQILFYWFICSGTFFYNEADRQRLKALRLKYVEAKCPALEREHVSIMTLIKDFPFEYFHVN